MGGSSSHPMYGRADYDTLTAELKQHVQAAIINDIQKEYEKAEYNGYKIYTSSSCKVDNSVIIDGVPRSAWRLGIERVTKRPYILTEVDVEDSVLMSVGFIHGSPAPAPAPAPLLARAAVRDGCHRGEICAITHDLLAELPSFCVGSCGHLFGPEAARYDSCPICRMRVQWTTVRREDVF